MRCCTRLSVALFVLGSLLPGCGSRIAFSPESPSRGTLRAARVGRTVLVEVGLENVPANIDVVTLGLKLRDETPIYPRTIRRLDRPAGELSGSPRIDFEFGVGDAPRRAPARTRPDRWVEVTFELLNGVDDADGGAFSLTLGDPDMSEACRLGMTATIAARDGSPSLFSCLMPAEPGDDLLLPLPPMPVASVSKASFRLAERAAPSRVPIVPRQVAWHTVFRPKRLAMVPAVPVGPTGGE